VDDLRRQIVRQERLASVGQLVSSIAHEINNPLQAIVGFAELMRMHHDLPASIRSDLALIHKEGTRACGMLRNLTTFTRQQPDTAVSVRLTDVIAAVAELRGRGLESADIELDVTTAPCSRCAPCSPSSSRCCSTSSSTPSTPSRPPTAPAESPHPIARPRRPRRAGGRGRRPGLSKEDEAKVFEAFFTTKPVGEGTGSDWRSAAASSIPLAGGSATGVPAGRDLRVELPAVPVEAA
jgi:two-component system NtrC family sensor kinase